MIAKAMMPLKQYCDGNAFISNISNSRRDGTQSIKDDWYLNYLGNSAQKSVDNHKNGEKYISVNYENPFFKWWNQNHKGLLILELASKVTFQEYLLTKNFQTSSCISFLWELQRPDIKEDEMNSFQRETVKFLCFQMF